MGEYYSNSKRYGNNSITGNLFNNNLYISSKDSFVRNYESFNRKFTDEEVECFVMNREIRNRPEGFIRKYNFNPNIHGPD